MSGCATVTGSPAAAASDDTEAQGRLVQAYVRQKWNPAADPKAVGEAGRALGPDLRTRVDLLGLDDRQLLYIDPATVLRGIDRIERDEQDEDVASAPKAARPQDGGPPRRTHNPPASRKRRPS